MEKVKFVLGFGAGFMLSYALTWTFLSWMFG